MKKRIVIMLLLFCLIFLFSSCSKNLEFENQEAMLAYLEGVWKEENLQNAEYYMIREGKLLVSDDSLLAASWEEWMENALEKRGTDAWEGLTYKAALNQSVSNRAFDEISFSIDPGKGILSWEEDGATITLSVQENELCITSEEKDDKRIFKKMNGDVLFSAEEYSSRFAEVKEDVLNKYEFPSNKFLKSTGALRTFVTKKFPKLDHLYLVSNDGSSVYTDSGTTKNYSASIVISKEMLVIGIDYFIGKEITVFYSLSDDMPQILVSSQTNTVSLDTLLEIAHFAVEDFPGILTKDQMLNLYLNGHATPDNGHTSDSVKVGSAEYLIYTPNLYYWNGKSHTASVLIQFDDKVPLKDVLRTEQKKEELESENQEETSDADFVENKTEENVPSQDVAQSGNSSSNSDEQSLSPKVCEHEYAAATCSLPEKCKKCGDTRGSAKEHDFRFTSCTTSYRCSLCNVEKVGSAPDHSWKAATCTEPEICSVCSQTRGSALGHNLSFTKCANECGYSDYSALAGNYSNIVAYDAQTGAPLSVSGVSVNSSGVLSFVFKGQNYSISLKQKNDSIPYEFDCYLNGTLLSGASYKFGFYDMTHFTWNSMPTGDNLYFYTE